MSLPAKSLKMRGHAVTQGRQIGGAVSAPYSDEWYTPPELVAALGPFDLDPCAGPMSHAVVNIRRPECGLHLEWRGRVWLNPPYSDLHLWLSRMMQHGSGIALVNVRAETQWFQQMAAAADSLFFPRGRIGFRSAAGKVGRHPIASVLVSFSPADTVAVCAAQIPGFLALPENRRRAAPDTPAPINSPVTPP